MQSWQGGTYSSFKAVTPSATTPINCRAIYVPGGVAASTVVVASAVGGTLVTFNVSANSLSVVLPIELNEGIIDVSSTATGLVALA